MMTRGRKETVKPKKLDETSGFGVKNPYDSLEDMARGRAGLVADISDPCGSRAQSADDTDNATTPEVRLDESRTMHLQEQIKEIITADSFVDRLVGLITDAILERVSQNVYQAMDHQFQARENEVSHLQEKVTSLEGELARVKDELDEHEQYSRRNSLRVYGVKEEKDENTDTVVIDLIKSKLDIEVTEKDLDRSHRVTPRIASNGPRPIIVKFARHNVRQKVYATRTKLKKTKIFIREDLTMKKQKLMRETLNNGSILKAWSNDGRIRALTKESKVINIMRLSDLDRL